MLGSETPSKGGQSWGAVDNAVVKPRNQTGNPSGTGHPAVPRLGPATIDNLHYWLGNCLTAGRKRLDSWFAGLGDQLVAVDVEGSVAYVAREDVETLGLTRPSNAVRFLPGHDQWVMGPGTKDTHVTPSAVRDLMTRKANPVIVGGVVSGTWARNGDELTVTWLDERRRPRRAIEGEAARLAALLDRDLRLNLAP